MHEGDRITQPSIIQPVAPPPRQRLREMRDDAIRIGAAIQGTIASFAVGVGLAAICLGAQTFAIVAGSVAMSVVSMQALIIQPAIMLGTRAPLSSAGLMMTRSRRGLVRFAGRLLRRASAMLPLWAGGSATLRRLNEARPHRDAARAARKAELASNCTVVAAPASSRRGELMSPVATMHIALGATSKAIDAQRTIFQRAAIAAAQCGLRTEDEDLWIAASKMLRNVLATDASDVARAWLQAEIWRWVRGLLSGWTPEQRLGSPKAPSLSAEELWRLEHYKSESLAFLAVAGNNGADVATADAAIRILQLRLLGATPAPTIEFINGPDTIRPGESVPPTNFKVPSGAFPTWGADH